MKDTYLNCGQKHIMILSSSQVLTLLKSRRKFKYERVQILVFHIFSVIQSSFCFPYRNQEDASLGTRLEHHNSRTQDNVKPENDTTVTKTSDSEKEEGHYEELVCLVRQFYVERPVNPAAIAYQNIETC